MDIAYLRIDAFAHRAFAGNPAAVCLLDRFLPDDVMQSVALELNLSETAFVVPRGGMRFGLRWFTPVVEVDLCGHATLASAHALFSTGLPGGQDTVTFETRSGDLVVRRVEDGVYSMDFPAEPARAHPIPDGLETALGARIVRFARNRMDFVAELEDAETVRGLRPEMSAIAALPARGLVVTAPGGATADGDPPGTPDFVSRFFGPQSGVPEDPVTGSAHCALAPWWHGRTGRSRQLGHQLSARGGAVETLVRGERVELVGRAITVGDGRIRVA